MCTSPLQVAFALYESLDDITALYSGRSGIPWDRGEVLLLNLPQVTLNGLVRLLGLHASLAAVAPCSGGQELVKACEDKGYPAVVERYLRTQRVGARDASGGVYSQAGFLHCPVLPLGSACGGGYSTAETPIGPSWPLPTEQPTLLTAVLTPLPRCTCVPSSRHKPGRPLRRRTRNFDALPPGWYGSGAPLHSLERQSWTCRRTRVPDRGSRGSTWHRFHGTCVCVRAGVCVCVRDRPPPEAGFIVGTCRSRPVSSQQDPLHTSSDAMFLKASLRNSLPNCTGHPTPFRQDKVDVESVSSVGGTEGVAQLTATVLVRPDPAPSNPGPDCHHRVSHRCSKAEAWAASAAPSAHGAPTQAHKSRECPQDTSRPPDGGRGVPV